MEEYTAKIDSFSRSVDRLVGTDIGEISFLATELPIVGWFGDFRGFRIFGRPVIV